MLLRPSCRARSVSHATRGVFSHVADALCRITQSPSRALNCIAEDIAKAADYECVLCQLITITLREGQGVSLIQQPMHFFDNGAQWHERMRT